ncbi:hypothetical protein GEMRC1_002725 [Eukaryota sp. GEM-RC1]
MSTDNNNYCVTCSAAPCYRVPPHSPRSQDPTMSRFFSEGPALQGTATSLLEGSALQSPSSVEGSALPDPSISEGSALQGLTSPEGSILQDTVSASGSALQNSVSATSPYPRGGSENSSSGDYNCRGFTFRYSPPATTSPSFERIRSLFSSKPKAKNTPFPSLNIEETITPSVTPLVPPRGFTFPERGSVPLPPIKSLRKATRKSDSKKSQVGHTPNPKTSEPPVTDPNPTRGHRAANQPVTSSGDPDLEDLVPYDVPEDEEFRQAPPVGPADHS